MGKDIVFAGTRETWERWRGFFESIGIELHLAEVITPVPAEDLEEKISSIDPAKISSALFTSKNAAKILISLEKGRNLLEELSRFGALITATGEGTASMLSKHGYRAFSPPVERVETLLKILDRAFRRGEIAVFSSDKLEIPGRDLIKHIKRIDVYKLEINIDGIAELEDMIRRGIRRIIVASQTASKALCMMKSLSHDDHLEIHAMTERIAEPLTRCGSSGFKVIIYGSDTFKGFMEAIIGKLLSSP